MRWRRISSSTWRRLLAARLLAVLVLAIDTSTPTVVSGLVRDGHTIAQRILPDCRHHNESLVPAIQQCLAEAAAEFAELDAVVVGCGPGPFTGLRVGMVTGAALADALQIPVYGVCSLDAIAQRIDAATLLVATDARRREVYWARYINGERVAGPEVAVPQSLAEPAEVVNVPARYAAAIPAAGRRVDMHPIPESLVSVAVFDGSPAPLTPLYLRRPDAKEPKPKPKSPAVPDVVID